jgi:hypothetical protein
MSILDLMTAERDKLNRAIEALGGDAPRRRGRPPGSGKRHSSAAPVQTESTKKRKCTAATRKKMQIAAKKRWAKAKRAK